MPLRSRLASLLRNILHKPRVERDLDDELHAYLDLATDEHRSAGMPAADARRAALIELQGVEQIIGVIAAQLLTRVIAAMLFGVSRTDVVTYGGVWLLLAAVAMLASYVPARRAAQVDPMIALRDS